MKSKSATKRALLSSAVSLVLCFTMLLGTTFAWFTDSASTAVNTIQSGTLDVDLVDEAGTTLVGEKMEFINKENSSSVLWEPGVTFVSEGFKVVNKGNLSLKYQLSITGVGGDAKLLEVIDFWLTTNKNSLDEANSVKVDLSDVVSLAPKAESAVYYLVGHMKEEAGNEYQDKTLDSVGITVFATQLNAEYDSFGPDYDIDSEFVVEVKNAEDLVAALKHGGDLLVMNDFEVTEPIVVPVGTKATLNLNGKTISADYGKDVGAVIKNAGNLTIIGGTVASEGENGGSAVVNNGNLTVIDAVLQGAPNAGSGWPSYTVNNTGTMTVDNTKITSYHGAVCSYGEGAVVTLNNSEIDMAGIPGFTSHGIYTYSNGAVIVNGGTYANKAADQNATGASVINGAVTVNAGTFSGRVENYYGTPVIKGGTFSAKPNSNFVAAGYAAVEGNRNGETVYTVVPDALADYEPVYDVGGIADAIEDGEKVVIGADITTQENTETLLESTSAVVVDGNGSTITTNGTGTTPGGSYDYGYVGFIPAPGEDATVSNVKVVGSGFVEVGHHGQGGGNYTINSLVVENLVATLNINNCGNNIAAAFSHYGTATMTDCVMTGTTTLKDGYKPYDAAFVNGTKTTIDGGKYGTIYLANQAHVTITDAEIGVIDSCAITTRNLGKLTIGAGAKIGTINLLDAGKYDTDTLTIEDGAQVGEIIYKGVTYTQAEWLAR